MLLGCYGNRVSLLTGPRGEVSLLANLRARLKFTTGVEWGQGLAGDLFWGWGCCGGVLLCCAQTAHLLKGLMTCRRVEPH